MMFEVCRSLALDKAKFHEQHEAERLNHKLPEAKRVGDFDLTGKSD